MMRVMRVVSIMHQCADYRRAHWAIAGDDLAMCVNCNETASISADIVPRLAKGATLVEMNEGGSYLGYLPPDGA